MKLKNRIILENGLRGLLELYFKQDERAWATFCSQVFPRMSFIISVLHIVVFYTVCHLKNKNKKISCIV